MATKTTKQLTETISQALSDGEVSELAQKFARRHLEYNALVSEKGDALSGYNAKLKTMEAEMDELARQIDHHRVDVEVPVVEEHDDERKMVLIKRADTGQILREREMDLQEKGAVFTRKQGSLFDGTVDPDAKPAEAAAAPSGEGESDNDTDFEAPPDERGGPAHDTEPPPPGSDLGDMGDGEEEDGDGDVGDSDEDDEELAAAPPPPPPPPAEAKKPSRRRVPRDLPPDEDAGA